jgi:hypothetical protein
MSVLQRVCAAGITSAAAYASFKLTTSSDKQDPRRCSSLLSAVLPVIRAQEPAPVPNDAVPADSVLMPKPVQSPYAACELSCFMTGTECTHSHNRADLSLTTIMPLSSLLPQQQRMKISLSQTTTDVLGVHI